MAGLGVPASRFPGMQVRWRADDGPGGARGGEVGCSRSSTHRLRWETLGRNRDAEPLLPSPDPTMLEVVTYGPSATASDPGPGQMGPANVLPVLVPADTIPAAALMDSATRELLQRAAAARRRSFVVAGVECALHSASSHYLAPGGGRKAGVLGDRYFGQSLGAVYSCEGPSATPLTVLLEGRPAVAPHSIKQDWRRGAGFAAVPMHGRLWHVVEDPPRDFVGQLTLSLLADGQPVDTEPTVQVRGVCDDTCLAGEVHGGSDGIWRALGSGEAVRNEWCGGAACLDANFDAVGTPSARANAALVRGTTVAFLGNSHVRNLFRCAADVISGGESRQNASLCPGAACPSCGNFNPEHGIDRTFRHAGTNISLEFYWTVVWDLPAEKRDLCGLRRTKDGDVPARLDNDDKRQCVAKALDMKAEYIGSRIGIDFLQTEVQRVGVLEHSNIL